MKPKILITLLTSILLTGCFATPKSSGSDTKPDTPSTEPTDPTDPVDPGTDPTDPVDPGTDPVDPGTDPVDPGTDPDEPDEPDDPVDPGTDPVDPGTDPADPDVPVTPDDPDEPGTDEETEKMAEIDSIQDVNILHAWNWKLNDIKSRLSSIKNAGYGAIQISPMQPKVDKLQWTGESTSSQWWKLYQPLAFKVAKSGETYLGTKSDLTSLCAEAKKKDIKIVVDIVSNHLAGDANEYNGQVYSDSKFPLHTYNGKADDNNGESVVKGNIGLPDIDTSNKSMQQAVLGMLKDYVDCGVTGFRFDAAKHIETPDDGSYASDYWPTILNGTTSYALSKGYEAPYYYGEILNTPGKGRSWSSYTKMMSICDNRQGTDTMKAVVEDSVKDLKSTYNTGEKADHLVLWAESHDTYANDPNPKSPYESTRNFTTEDINKAYMIQASRKDAATLYFARPTNMGVKLGTIDDNSGWQNPEVTAINKFHRRYLDKAESISNNNNCFVNVRGTGDYAGAAIININANSTQEVVVSGLKDGSYTDLISKKDFTVSKEKVTVSFTNGACILVPKDGEGDDPVDPGTEEEITYNSSVVIKGYDSSKSYLAWVWGNGQNSHWVELSTDHDAIGLNLSSGDFYIIVEFNSGTTSSTADWNKKVRQTIDYQFTGTQTIYDLSDLSWK